MRSIKAFLIVAIFISGGESLMAQGKAIPVPGKAIPIAKAPPAKPADPIKKLQKQIKILQGQVKKLKAEVGKNTKDFLVLMTLVKANSVQIGDLAKEVKKNKDEIAKHETEITAIAGIVEDNSEMLKQTVVWDPKTREAYLNVLGNMQKLKFREEFRKTVRFELRIENYFGIPKVLVINGVSWTVPTGSCTLPVAQGRVTVRRLGNTVVLPNSGWKYDKDKNVWFLGYDFI